MNIAIVPMKAHNVRLPGKNLKLLGGFPLFYHLTQTLQDSNFDEIVMDLNGEELVEAVADARATHSWSKVRISRRPSAYCGDEIGGNQLLERFKNEWKADDIIAQLHVTSPFLTVGTINGALNSVRTDRSKESMFSATSIVQRVWMVTPNGPEAVNFDPKGPTLRTQDLPECGHENGAFFIFRSSYFNRTGQRNGADSRMRLLDFPEAIDVDTAKDFQLAELAMELLYAQRGVKDTEASS